MESVHKHFSRQFQKWEKRGRGWQVFEQPVQLEPPFSPFVLRAMTDTPAVDDGSRPSFLGSLFRKVVTPAEPPPQVEDEPEEDAEPTPLIREPLIELQIALPAELNCSKDSLEQLFNALTLCKEPLAFELFGIPGKVVTQFAAASYDIPLLRRQLQAFFPEAQYKTCKDVLPETWLTCSGEEDLVVEFGLGREFMFSLASGKLDPFVAIVGALSELQPGELGLFQVLWQPVYENWQDNIIRSVTHPESKPLFVNMPELMDAAEKKVLKPLFAAVVRIATKAGTFEQALQIAGDMAGSLRAFANPQGNHLIPLKNNIEEYPHDEHIADLLCRQSRRSGMLLNGDELAGFVHLPSSEVQSPVFVRDSGSTKAAPDTVRNAKGLLLGNNVHLDQIVPVVLTPEQRVYHTHIIGTTGTGKSTLLFNLIRQDIESHQGVAVLDPHGDLIERLLGIIPKERIEDVVLVDLGDEEFPVGFNILHAHTSVERKLLASDLVSLFQRLSTSWGDQMNSVLQNAILAFLSSSRGGTLADLLRFLIEDKYRKEFLETVSDPNTLYYWNKGFSLLSGNKSRGSVITRLNEFLAEEPIRNMVAQETNRLNFEDIMDTGKIFLAKLPEGIVGKENSYLLGAVLISKFQQLVMARQAKKIAARRDFWIYIDEFANFITPSMAEILSGARKYRIGLTLAHHELHQLQRSAEVASAVMAHPYTRVVFRVSDDDAKKLADGFSSFEANHLKNLGKGQALCRVERSDFDFNLSVPLPELPDEELMVKRRDEVIAASRRQYAVPKEQVEVVVRKAWALGIERVTTEKPKPPDEPPASPPPPPIAPKPTPPVPPSTVVTPPTHSESPQIAEIPKTAEVPKPAEPLSKVETLPVKREQPRDLGRGKTLHTDTQKRLQKEARKLGFRADIEKQLVQGSNKATDVLCSTGKGEIVIAVEVAMFDTINEEYDHVKNCLEAGISRIAVIANARNKLDEIAAAVQGGLGPEAAVKVSYHTPDEFIAELKKLAATMKLNPSPTDEFQGRTVHRHYPAPSPEGQQKEEITYSLMAEAIRPTGQS